MGEKQALIVFTAHRDFAYIAVYSLTVSTSERIKKLIF